MKRAFPRASRRDAMGLLATAALPLLGLSLHGLPWSSRSAQADVGTTAAEAVVDDLATQVWALFRRTDLSDQERTDALAVLLASQTDVELLSRLVLGRYWRQLDDQQRERYEALFREVVMGMLAGRLNLFAKNATGQLKDHFTITSSAPAGERDVLVRSRVWPESGDSLAVDWRLREGSDGPAIIDVIIGGVSLLVSQRSEFAAVIERSDMNGLLAELSARASSKNS
jgi:phospholipid transport system substrate-binding protein